VGQARDRARLGQEAMPVLLARVVLQGRFQCDIAPQRVVARAIDDAQTAAPSSPTIS